MGREGDEMLKSRRVEFTKKARVLCNFCEHSGSRYEQRPHEQDSAAVSMESELKRLRLLTRRMTGNDLEGLSFPELQLLDSQLQQVLLIVKNQKMKAKLEEEKHV